MSWTMTERRLPAGSPLGGLGVARVEMWEIRWSWDDGSVRLSWTRRVDKPWDQLSEGARNFHIQERDKALGKVKP